MSEPTLDLSWERTLKVWWAFTWRTFVGSILLGAVLGGLAGFMVGIAGHPELGGQAGRAAGQWAFVPISILTIRMVLKKRPFGDFRIGLVPRDMVAVATPTPEQSS